MTETDEFISDVFGPALDLETPLYLCVFSLPAKRSSWHRTVESAAQIVERLNDDQEDVYLGVGLSAAEMAPARRCGAKDVACLVGLWADIDIRHPVHKKKNLAINLEEALSIVNVRIEPTITIHSGHGIQVWWLFKEPWLLDSEEEHHKASELVRQWHEAVKIDAAKYGATVDATQDLSRILRIPGTTNWKDEPVPVSVITNNHFRYDPSEFDSVLPDPIATTILEQPNLIIGHLELRDDCAPPFEKFDALLKLERKFKLSWEHNRRDLKDQTASAYDLSLASLAISYGWVDQEVACLLIAHRRKHNEDLKLREDYYARTIAKAREGKIKSQADEVLNGVIDDLKAASYAGADSTIIDKDKRDNAITALGVQFEINLQRIVKYVAGGGDTNNAIYTLEGEGDKKVTVGTAADLQSQNKVRTKIMEAWGRVIPLFKPERWLGIVQTMVSAAYIEELQVEASSSGQMGSWISSYIAERHILTSKAELENDRNPYYDEDQNICIFGNDFRFWLRTNQQEDISQIQMGTRLRGKRTTRSAWVIPSSWHVIEDEALSRVEQEVMEIVNE